LIRFGVPDAKLEKWMIDRRVMLLEGEGIDFHYNVDVGGEEVSVEQLRDNHDALVIATGSRIPRELEVPGAELTGVHHAMDYLYQRNRYVAATKGDPAREVEPGKEIVAEGKNVIVIGGGDTGMDCLSNANREGAASVLLLDVYPEVPLGGRYPDSPWPMSPRRLATTYALDEGGEREFGRQITHLTGADGQVTEAHGREVTGTSSRNLEAVEGSEFSVPADLVLIAVGFTGPEKPLLEKLGTDLDDRGNVRAKHFHSSIEGVFAAGDARVGQSLIVTAIAEGRRCARVVEGWLREQAVNRTAELKALAAQQHD
jgi:glutamate synthase (NADPH/NADH) small chain